MIRSKESYFPITNMWYASVNEIFISDFSDISAQLKLYQRFLRYIDLPTKTDKKHIVKKVLQNNIWSTFLLQ